jgi:hypothetical protein
LLSSVKPTAITFAGLNGLSDMVGPFVALG